MFTDGNPCLQSHKPLYRLPGASAQHVLWFLADDVGAGLFYGSHAYYSGWARTCTYASWPLRIMCWSSCLLFKLTSLIYFLLQVKCHQYWPNHSGSATYGGFLISCQTEEGNSAFLVRDITLTHIEVSLPQVLQSVYHSQNVS